MLNRFKNFITLVLCAALLNTCVLPSATILAIKSPANKRQQAKPSQAQNTQKEEINEENPTMQESWQKVIDFEWKKLTKADAWNIGKSACGALFAFTVAYALFKSKPTTGDNQTINPTNNKPGNKPPIAPTHNTPDNKTAIVPLQDVDQHGPDYTKKLQDNGNIISLSPTDESSSTENKTTEKSATKTKKEEKPTSLYPFADQVQRNGAIADIQVPRQKGLLCAIHALHDGNFINEKFMQADNQVLENLDNLPVLSEQISQERVHANIQFDTNCKTWTDKTGQARIANASEKYISYQLQRCMRLTEEEQNAQSGFFSYIFSIFSSTLHTLTPQENNSRALMASILRDALTRDENAQGIVLWNDANQIDLEELHTVILNLARQSNRNLTAQQQADLRAFIGALDTEQLKAHFNGTLTTNDNFLRKISAHVDYYHQHLNTDFSGENLDSEELELLIEQLGKHFAFAYDRENNLKIDFFNSYDQEDQDLHMVNNNHAKEMYNLNGKISIINNTAHMAPDSRDGTIIAVIKHQMSQCDKFVHTFMIRLGAVKVGNAHSTHWISVTLVKFNNKNHYFITDSIGATNIHNLNVTQLINALEQPDDAAIITDNIPNNTTHNTHTDNEISIKSTSQNKTHTNTQKEHIVIPSTNPEKLVSIPTLPQDGNSCAYHALKNGNSLLDMFKNEKMQPLKNDFNAIVTRIGDNLCREKSQNKVNILFDEQKFSGEWRDIIRQQRVVPILKQCIQTKLERSILPTEEQHNAYTKELENYEVRLHNWQDGLKELGKEFEIEYRDANPEPRRPILPLSNKINNTANAKERLNTIANACARQLMSTGVPIILDGPNLVQLFIDIVRNDNQIHLKDRHDSFEQCIRLLDPAELKKIFGNEMNVAQLLRGRNELLADNLSDEELQLLLKNGNIENAADISIITDVRTFILNIFPHIQEKIGIQDTCSHAFLMRTGFNTILTSLAGEFAQSSNGTHWIAVVLYRLNAENYYIVADSCKGDGFKIQITKDLKTLMKLIDLTKEYDAETLINLLETDRQAFTEILNS